jgi:hypothetical protein
MGRLFAFSALLGRFSWRRWPRLPARRRRSTTSESPSARPSRTPSAGTSVFNGLNNIQLFADGTFKVETHDTQVFTSAATGRSVVLFYSYQFVEAGPIDNGDGTVTFTGTYKGLKEKLKLPNGTILSRDAGLVTFSNTFDATTGDFLGETVSAQNGPHPDLDSGGALFCDVIVPALS